MELFLFFCLRLSWQTMDFNYLGVSLGIFGFFKDLVILLGGFIAFKNYQSQTNQRKIDNGFKSLQRFRENVSSEDMEVWKYVKKYSHESMKRQTEEDKSFIVLANGHDRQAVPLARLFMLEGKGLLLSNSRLLDSQDICDLNFSGIRNIADQLNVIGYEFLNGQISTEVIYYEIGEIMDSIYQWLQEAEPGAKERYKYFLEMYSKKSSKFREIPKKMSIFFD